MITIVCAVVGEDTTYYVCVDTTRSKSVKELKDEINELLPSRMRGRVRQMELYLAKAPDGAWMNEFAVENLASTKLSDAFAPMSTQCPIQQFCFPDEAGREEVHVLVVVPKRTADELSSVACTSPDTHRQHRWFQINENLRQTKDKRARKYNEVLSTPHSSLNTTDISSVFLKDMVKYVESVQGIPSCQFQVLSTTLTGIMKCFNCDFMSVIDSKVRCSFLIAPILWYVVRLLPGVSVQVQHDLKGVRVDAHGRFHFVLMRGTKRICIIDTIGEKFGKVEKGMAKALGGCEVIADLDDTHAVYAVVTNAEKWIFMKSLDEEIAYDELNSLAFSSDGVPDEQMLLNIVGKLHSLLTSTPSSHVVHQVAPNDTPSSSV